jgi:sugar lactone lactonase YvrE
MTSTLAGALTAPNSVRFKDPFGVAIAPDQTIYVSDGETGHIWQVALDGQVKPVAENLDVPSGIALAPDGTLVVAETGSHTIIRVDLKTGQSQIIAGIKGRSGFNDGEGTRAQFNGPIGLAVGPDGTIYVADTYNDRIRAIDAGSRVRTIAGGNEPGMIDAGTGQDARFDTPCGIAVAADGALLVADTGNNRLRRVEPGGAVTTIAGTGERGISDGPPLTALFDKPMSLAVDQDGTVYVTDAGGSCLRACRFNAAPEVRTVVGGRGPGLVDGPFEEARLRAPSGVAVAENGTVIIADTGNRLIRALVGPMRERGSTITREAALALYPTATEIRQGVGTIEPRWPYEPPERPREIAATFGEIRGEITAENREAYFHNGLDIPGGYGETARVVRTERILQPLAVEDVGTARERIRFPQLGYIHLRIGRDQSDRPFDDGRFYLRRDPVNEKMTGVRVRRGERFQSGDAIGTLNNQYHVHLIAGPPGGELNALAALELPGIKDTVAPTIEQDGVRLFSRDWQELRADNNGKGKTADERIKVEGDVRIVVRAFDQMDGNAARRRLGIYRLGYQILNADGTPAPKFEQPLMTVSFESLPVNGINAQFVYAESSRAGATGETIFAYIVTNLVRDHQAAEGFWQTALLPAGDYTVRVFAEDYFGNRTTRDVPVRIG